MKKQIVMLISALCFFTACTKDKSAPPAPIPATTKGSFVWQEDGGPESTADSAFWTSWSTGTGVRAYKGGMANFFEINWDGSDNTDPGTKTLLAAMGVTFLKGSETYTNPAKDILTITSRTRDSLSGHFEMPVSGGSIRKITVKFTNLPKR